MKNINTFLKLKLNNKKNRKQKTKSKINDLLIIKKQIPSSNTNFKKISMYDIKKIINNSQNNILNKYKLDKLNDSISINSSSKDKGIKTLNKNYSALINKKKNYNFTDEQLNKYKEIFNYLFIYLKLFIQKKIFNYIILYTNIKNKYISGLIQLIIAIKRKPFNYLRIIQQREYYQVILRQFYIPYLNRAFTNIKLYIINKQKFTDADNIIKQIYFMNFLKRILFFIEIKENFINKKYDYDKIIEEEKEDISYESSSKVDNKNGILNNDEEHININNDNKNNSVSIKENTIINEEQKKNESNNEIKENEIILNNNINDIKDVSHNKENSESYDEIKELTNTFNIIINNISISPKIYVFDLFKKFYFDSKNKNNNEENKEDNEEENINIIKDEDKDEIKYENKEEKKDEIKKEEIIDFKDENKIDIKYEFSNSKNDISNDNKYNTYIYESLSDKSSISAFPNSEGNDRLHKVYNFINQQKIINDNNDKIKTNYIKSYNVANFEIVHIVHDGKMNSIYNSINNDEKKVDKNRDKNEIKKKLNYDNNNNNNNNLEEKQNEDNINISYELDHNNSNISDEKLIKNNLNISYEKEKENEKNKNNSYERLNEKKDNNSNEKQNENNLNNLHEKEKEKESNENNDNNNNNRYNETNNKNKILDENNKKEEISLFFPFKGEIKKNLMNNNINININSDNKKKEDNGNISEESNNSDKILKNEFKKYEQHKKFINQNNENNIKYNNEINEKNIDCKKNLIKDYENIENKNNESFTEDKNLLLKQKYALIKNKNEKNEQNENSNNNSIKNIENINKDNYLYFNLKKNFGFDVNEDNNKRYNENIDVTKSDNLEENKKIFMNIPNEIEKKITEELTNEIINDLFKYEIENKDNLLSYKKEIKHQSTSNISGVISKESISGLSHSPGRKYNKASPSHKLINNKESFPTINTNKNIREEDDLNSSIFTKTIFEIKKDIEYNYYEKNIFPKLLNVIGNDINNNYLNIINNLKKPLKKNEKEIMEDLSILITYETIYDNNFIKYNSNFNNKDIIKKEYIDKKIINQFNKKLKSKISYYYDKYNYCYLNQCIYDTTNEIINNKRMYGNIGEPLLWSMRNRKIEYEYKNTKLFKNLFISNIKNELKKYYYSKIGAILENNEHLNVSEFSKERDLKFNQNIKEELKQDNEFEKLDEQETIVKITISKIIMNQLLNEVIEILEHIQYSRNEPEKYNYKSIFSCDNIPLLSFQKDNKNDEVEEKVEDNINQ